MNRQAISLDHEQRIARFAAASVVEEEHDHVALENHGQHGPETSAVEEVVEAGLSSSWLIQTSRRYTRARICKSCSSRSSQLVKYISPQTSVMEACHKLEHRVDHRAEYMQGTGQDAPSDKRARRVLTGISIELT